MALNNVNYDKLDKPLEIIHNESIKMDDKEKVLLNQRFQRVLYKLLEEMQKDPIFKEVHNRVGYTGSYYDGIRVAAATEFDLNLILNPKSIKLDISKERCKPGFIAIKMVDKRQDEWFKRNWESNGYLNPDKVKRWLQSVVWKTLENCKGRIDNCTVRSSRSGPAVTLTVISQEHPPKTISIDLVPVLEFPSNQWPPGLNRKPKKTLNGTFEDSWFAVPKSAEHWRLSFPRQEQCIIKDHAYLKYILRLLKKVRDDFNMHQVASYYIKTLFLHELERLDKNVWSRTKGRLFMLMLMRFQEALEARRIPFYWDPNCNLVDWIRPDYLVNSAGRLKRFIKKIDSLVLLDSTDEIDRFLREQLRSHRDDDDFVVVNAPRRNGTFPPVAEHVEEQKSTCSLQ